MKKILIVVDYQFDFASPTGALSVPNADKIVDNIQSYINDKSYENIIYTFDTHTSDKYNGSDESKIFPSIHCEFGTIGWNFYKIKPRYKNWDNFIANRGIDEGTVPFNTFIVESEMFFTKDVFDIWQGNSIFKSIFTNTFKPKDTIIDIVGVATNYCVFMNVMGLVKNGYTVNVLSDAVEGIKSFPDGSIDDSFQTNINVMKNKGVTFSGDIK